MSSLLDRPAEQTPRAAVLLGDADWSDVVRLVDRDPIVNAVLASRLRAVRQVGASRLGGPLLGVRAESGELTGAAYAGAVLLPVGGSPVEWHALAEEFRRWRRPCSSIVGRAEAVQAIWGSLAGAWGPARVVRPVQHLAVLDSADVLPAADPRVRQVRAAEIDLYLPAAAAMFTEELAISPYTIGSVGDYRRRVASLVEGGRAFAIVDESGVVFKADLGAVSDRTCQVQGVWVRPDARGSGVGTAALPAVLRRGLELAPTVSLYVNEFNQPARRMYARLGMRETDVLSTVLF
jgi:hypothetical protein